MGAEDTQPQTQNRISSILTDLHFWVPVIVLAGGLMLLRFMR